jgi:hypothetical protein
MRAPSPAAWRRLGRALLIIGAVFAAPFVLAAIVARATTRG